MTEINLDAYFAKLVDIELACDNITTNKANLELLINDLTNIDTNINTDITTMAIPSSMLHFHKFLSVEYMRNSKIHLQNCLYNLIKNRNAEIKNMAMDGTIVPLINIQNYGNDTQDIINYVRDIVNACNCMTSRINVVKTCAFN